MMADLADQHTFHDDESLDSLLAAYKAQNAETLRVFAQADLDATIAVPDHLQALYEDPQWTVRWVLLHIIEELARHAGHADMIRESIDGATMYQLIAALEDRSRQRWFAARVSFAKSVPSPAQDVWTGPQGWVDKQFADGTVEFRPASELIYTTKPGGALFFPILATPTGDVAIAEAAKEPGRGRGVMMPRRKRTRKQQHDERIDAERRVNEQILKGQRCSSTNSRNADKPAKLPPSF